jgi:hypothetical protein
MGSSPEVQEAAIRNAGSGLKLAAAFLEGIRQSVKGKETGES